VYDVLEETFSVPNISIKENNIVIKWPHVEVIPHNFYMKSHKDFKIVMIIKNPYDVIGSIIKRFGFPIPEIRNVNAWRKYAEWFYKIKNDIPSNIFTIKYEEMFDNDYEKIREMFIFLNLPYSKKEIIFNGRECFIGKIEIPKDEPLPTEHGAFRTWQINQKFENKTGKNLKFLPDNLKNKIDKLSITKKLGY